MVRSINSRGEPFPNVRLKRTLRLNTDYDANKPAGGFDPTPHAHQRFPWLHPTRSTDKNPADHPTGRFLQQQTANGYKTVEVFDQGIDRQLAINNEDSHILTFAEAEQLGVGPLIYNTPDNATNIKAIRTPEALQDTVLNLMEQGQGYRIIASDANANTITVLGRRWYANRPSDTGVFTYTHYMGINDYMRDRLTTDQVTHYPRNKLYDNIHVELAGQRRLINRIETLNTGPVAADLDVGLVLGGFTPGETLTVEVRQINAADEYSQAIVGTITLSGAPGATTTRSFPQTIGSASVIGQAPPARAAATLTAPTNLQLMSVSQTVLNFTFRRAGFNTFYELVINGVVYAHLFAGANANLPAGAEAFAQVDYQCKTIHVLHFDGDGDFPAPALYDPGVPANYGTLTMFRRPQWLTSMLAWTGTFHQRFGVYRLRVQVPRSKFNFVSAFLWGGYSEVDGRTQDRAGKENEQDIFEFPGGTYVFHNMWKPSGGMYDYAARNNETPVMDNPEWESDTNVQHQVLIPPDHPHYVDPHVEFDMLYAIWPEGNEALKEGNRNEVYVRTADGEYRFTCGAVASEASRDGNPLNKLVAFLCNPVDGNFVAGMERYAPNSAVPDNPDEIILKILDFEAYQFQGFEAGGASLPDDSGQYPQPMLPTPGLTPEASGTGIITTGEYGFFNQETSGDVTVPQSPTINVGQYGHGRVYKNELSTANTNWFDIFSHDLMDEGLHQTGNKNVVGGPKFRRWACFYNRPDDTTKIVNGALELSCLLTDEQDVGRKTYMHRGNVHNPQNNKAYLSFLVSWARTFDNNLGHHITDPNKPNKTIGPGSVIEIVVNFERMRARALRFSAYLLPAYEHDSNAYNEDGTIGNENDWPEVDFTPGFENYVQAKIITNAAAGNTTYIDDNGNNTGGSINLIRHIPDINLQTGDNTFTTIWEKDKVVWLCNGVEYVRETDPRRIQQTAAMIVLSREGNSGVRYDDVPLELRNPNYAYEDISGRLPGDPGIFGHSMWQDLDILNGDTAVVKSLNVWSFEDNTVPGIGVGDGVSGIRPTMVSSPPTQFIHRFEWDFNGRPVNQVNVLVGTTIGDNNITTRDGTKTSILAFGLPTDFKVCVRIWFRNTDDDIWDFEDFCYPNREALDYKRGTEGRIAVTTIEATPSTPPTVAGSRYLGRGNIGTPIITDPPPSGKPVKSEVRIRKQDAASDIIISGGIVNKPAATKKYEDVLIKPDGGRIKIRRGRLEP